MKDLLRFPLRIQLFGEEAETGMNEDLILNSAKTVSVQQKAFTQADIDRAVTKAIQTVSAKNKQAMDAAVHQAVMEQKHLAALFEEKLREEAYHAAAKAYEEKEQELNRKILVVDGCRLLIEESLPQEALEFVLGDDMEATKARVEKLKVIITKQVEGRLGKYAKY